MDFNLRKILKALLFSTSEPLSIKDVQSVITRYHQEESARKSRAEQHAPQSESEGAYADNLEPGDIENEQTVIEDIFAQVPTLLTATQIREAMEEIAAELESSSEVYRLLQSSSGFKLAISKEYADWIRLLRNDPRPQKLTRAALETLAIVAYRQPVTRAEIEAIRGVSADSAITRLIERELIYISGRADLPGRPIQYSTTQNFLDYVGINSIEELPASDVLTPNQISEWIMRASSPSGIGDRDVGLPEEENLSGGGVENAQSETSHAADHAERAGQEETGGEPQLRIGDGKFPSDASESAGAQEEFENSPDDLDADEKGSYGD